MPKGNKRRQYRTLLSVLANGSTQEARDLLKKNTGEDASNYSDLEYKLAKFYATSSDKKQLDKEFAEIHPHKEFILKYCAPEPPKIVVESELSPIIEKKSNCEGDPDCNCNKQTQGMAGFLGADGSGLYSNAPAQKDHTIMVIGIVAIVAMVSLTLAYRKQ